jgi:hypothetical protein
VLVLLLHIVFVVPFGILSILLSWPHRAARLTFHAASGGKLAQVQTFLVEALTLGPSLVIPALYLCGGSYSEVFVFAKTKDMGLLTRLLEQVPWPAGPTSKLLTLAQCRCPMAQLLVGVESVGDTGTLKVNEHRQSSLALHGGGRAALREIDLENERRSDILIVWQKLQATSGDVGWLKVIEGAHEDGLDLNFPTAGGETVREKSWINRGCRKDTLPACVYDNHTQSPPLLHPHMQYESQPLHHYTTYLAPVTPHPPSATHHPKSRSCTRPVSTGMSKQ